MHCLYPGDLGLGSDGRDLWGLEDPGVLQGVCAGSCRTLQPTSPPVQHPGVPGCMSSMEVEEPARFSGSRHLSDGCTQQEPPKNTEQRARRKDPPEKVLCTGAPQLCARRGSPILPSNLSSPNNEMGNLKTQNPENWHRFALSQLCN